MFAGQTSSAHLLTEKRKLEGAALEDGSPNKEAKMHLETQPQKESPCWSKTALASGASGASEAATGTSRTSGASEAATGTSGTSGASGADQKDVPEKQVEGAKEKDQKKDQVEVTPEIADTEENVAGEKDKPRAGQKADQKAGQKADQKADQKVDQNADQKVDQKAENPMDEKEVSQEEEDEQPEKKVDQETKESAGALHEHMEHFISHRPGAQMQVQHITDEFQQFCNSLATSTLEAMLADILSTRCATWAGRPAPVPDATRLTWMMARVCYPFIFSPKQRTTKLERPYYIKFQNSTATVQDLRALRD